MPRLALHSCYLWMHVLHLLVRIGLNMAKEVVLLSTLLNWLCVRLVCMDFERWVISNTYGTHGLCTLACSLARVVRMVKAHLGAFFVCIDTESLVSLARVVLHTYVRSVNTRFRHIGFLLYAWMWQVCIPWCALVLLAVYHCIRIRFGAP